VTQFDKKEFESIFQVLVDEDKFSGVVLVAENGKVVFERTYGMACKSFNVTNQMDTKFNIGSLNKLITKTAILQLHQKGLLDFEDLVGKFLPEFPEAIASKIRVKHLISFTSGLGDYFNEKFMASIGRLRKVDDFVLFFIDDELLFEPGEKMQYSNAGYVVLGKIIEAITGEDYYEYVRENIYQPAGMNDSDHYEVDSITPKMAIGYTRHMPCESYSSDELTYSNKRRCNFFSIGSRGSPAGGGYSTSYDLLKFDRAISQEILLDSEHSKMILRPLDASPDSKPKSAILAGGAPGLTALYMKFFDSGHTVIILSNYDPEDVEPVANQVRNLIMQNTEQESIIKLGQND
jgi:D-alanyl-D-alanine carboxypeptidase